MGFTKEEVNMSVGSDTLLETLEGMSKKDPQHSFKV